VQYQQLLAGGRLKVLGTGHFRDKSAEGAPAQGAVLILHCHLSKFCRYVIVPLLWSA